MGFLTVRAAIHTNLRAFTDVTNIIGGMPTSIHRAPAFITQFEGGNRIGQTSYFNWRYLITAVMDHQANDIAETEIDAMAAQVFPAFSPKLTDSGGHLRAKLGGAAEQCWFEDVRSGDTDGYITFGSGESAKTYRRIAFVLMVKTVEVF